MKIGKIEKEKIIIGMMISLYCRKKEGNKDLCNNCKELLNYALNRLTNCNFGENKPTCRQCPIHCYNQEKRSKIREIMRYSGPRMILYHPKAVIAHMYREYINAK